MCDRAQWSVARVAKRDQVHTEPAVGKAEYALGLRLIGNCGMTRSDPEIGGRKHDVRRGLTEVVLEPGAMPIILGHGSDQRDRRGRPGYVAGTLPYLREFDQVVAVGDNDEVPRLPVVRRRGPPSRFEYSLELVAGYRFIAKLAHVTTRPDRIPRLHVTA